MCRRRGGRCTQELDVGARVACRNFWSVLGCGCMRCRLLTFDPRSESASACAAGISSELLTSQSSVMTDERIIDASKGAAEPARETPIRLRHIEVDGANMDEFIQAAASRMNRIFW
jgi:hypothetical protein